jgi:hypothetical protein
LSLKQIPTAGTLAALAKVPTRLAASDADAQRRLVEWGYALADVPIHNVPSRSSRGTLPFVHNIAIEFGSALAA